MLLVLFYISVLLVFSTHKNTIFIFLQPSSSLPQVEITLLRQNKSGIGHNKDMKFAVDETVTIDMLQWVDNPVTSQEYLHAHNAEILVGPINLANHLDLTEQSGIITLTSPDLLKSKLRNLMLHIKAVNAKDSTKSKISRFESNPSTNFDKIRAPKRKTDFYMGCDAIHELSITLHTLKVTDIPNERLHRNLMLDSDIIVESLIHTSVNSRGEILSTSLDILDWIASVRLTRNGSNSGRAPIQQLEFLSTIEENLPKLLHHCLIDGGRSIAHKCMRLMITCIRYVLLYNHNYFSLRFSLIPFHLLY